MNEFVWTPRAVAEALDLPRRADGGSAASYSGVSTDTRQVAAGSLFVALRGERFDAHDFLAAAADAGATGAVVSDLPEARPAGLTYYLVPDTLRALGQLARHRRRALRGRVLAVAGSNGKTTTKDLLRSALGASLRVHATEGNLNNQIGAPLTLLAAPDDADAVVVEIGTNEPGEIALLAAIVEPDAGVITSIGEEHLEKLGDLDGVLREETALFGGIRGDGPVFVAEEPAELPAEARAALGSARVHVAGFGAGADLRPDGGAAAVAVLPDGTTRWSWNGVPVHVPLPGHHNVRNALLALGVAREWGVAPEAAAAAVGAMPAPKMRGEWHRVGRMGVLADCYNANPASVRAAVDLLASLPAGGAKVAVVGTMRELGDHARAMHRECAAAIRRHIESGAIERVVATGEFVRAFEEVADGALGERLIAHPEPTDAYDGLRPHLRGDETILLKASRGERLERWLPLLERDWAR